jgi:hypothetical protein
VDSLRPLWAWVSRWVVVERNDDTSSLPPWAVSAGVRNDRLSASTLALAVDAGFYLADVFRNKDPNVQWVMWKGSKTDYYRYRPVLTGFGPYPLVPHDLVIANCWRAGDGEYSEDQLLKSFTVWERKLGAVAR